MHHIAMAALLGFGVVIGGCADRATAAPAPPAKAATCRACHGAPGQSATAPMFPIIAGQHAVYLEAELRAFRSGEREDAIMAGIAATLTDEEIKALAAYYQALGTQPYRLAPP